MLVSEMTLGERLREAREHRKLSRYAAAKACGISQTSYDKIELDVTKNPGREMLRALSAGLGIPISTLMGDAGEEVREPEGPVYGDSADHDQPREVHAVSVPIQAVLVGGPPGEAMEDTGERYDLLHHHWRPGRSVIRIKGDSRGGVRRTLEISLDLEDLGPAVGEEQLGQLLRASFTDGKGTTERTVFVPEAEPEPGDE